MVGAPTGEGGFVADVDVLVLAMPLYGLSELDDALHDRARAGGGIRRGSHKVRLSAERWWCGKEREIVGARVDFMAWGSVFD